jgi:hypothetical protein
LPPLLFYLDNTKIKQKRHTHYSISDTLIYAPRWSWYGILLILY